MAPYQAKEGAVRQVRQPAKATAGPAAQPGQKPPEDLAAEISVLGAMLLHNNTIDMVVPILKPESFSAPAHRTLFEAILKLHANKSAVDLVTLRAQLQRDGALDAVGGVDYLMRLVDAVPAAANAEHYARVVREKSTARSLITAAEQIQTMAYACSHSEPELLDRCMKLVFDIAESDLQSQVGDLRDILRNVFEQLDKWKDRKDRLTGLATGYYDLDELTSGLQPGELVILAARPSMGKTTLALNIAQHVGVQGQTGVAIFSLEMARQQVALNMLCCYAQVNSHRLRRGRLSESELGNLSLAVGKLSAAPIYIDDTAGLTPMELRAKSRRLRSQQNIGLIIVDYLQLMQGSGAENRQQEISQISRQLKALGRELNLPIIAVAQLNRGVEDRLDHRPRMSDLRESGSLEQDADVVALLHRPSYYRSASEDSGEDNTAELILAKQRNGPTGVVKLTFLQECMRFENSTSGQEY